MCGVREALERQGWVPCSQSRQRISSSAILSEPRNMAWRSNLSKNLQELRWVHDWIPMAT